MKKEIWICDICGAEFDNENDYDRHCKECLKNNYKAIGIKISPESTTGLNVRYNMDWHKRIDAMRDGIRVWDWRKDMKKEDCPHVSSKSHEVIMWMPRDDFGVSFPKGMEDEGIEKLKEHFIGKVEEYKQLIVASLDEIKGQIKREADGEDLESSMEDWRDVKKI